MFIEYVYTCELSPICYKWKRLGDVGSRPASIIKSDLGQITFSALLPFSHVKVGKVC